VSSIDGICKASLETSTSEVINERYQSIKHVLVDGSVDVVSNASFVGSKIGSQKVLALGCGEALALMILVMGD